MEERGEEGIKGSIITTNVWMKRMDSGKDNDIRITRNEGSELMNQGAYRRVRLNKREHTD